MRSCLLLSLTVLLSTACGNDRDAGSDDVVDESPDAAIDEPDPDAAPDAAAPRAEHEACEETDDCVTGLDCYGGECVVRVASCAGDPCDDDEYCVHYGTEDDDGQVVDRYNCALRRELDQPCDRQPDKDVSPCADGLACIDEVCGFALGEGEGCSDGECAAGLYCGGTCRPQAAEDASCLNSEECAAGLHCDAVDQRCRPRAADDGACFDNEAECGVGLECDFAPGLVCTHWIDCGASQTACCATDTGAACVPDTAPGECAPPVGSCAIDTFTDGDF